jgi:hypothetical protein
MDILDIFNQDAFRVTALTDAMREIKYKPGLIGSLGLFTSSSTDTLDIAIEKDKAENLFLVPSSPRGAPGATFGANRRSIRSLRIPHFQVDDAIYADAVQQVRAFGDAVARETFVGKIAERGAEVSQSFALTEEYHRLKVVTEGKLLDSDGSTMFDYATEFGESLPAEIDFDLDNANPAKGVLREACDDLHRAIAASLDGLPYDRVIGLSGDQFFKDLTKHKEIYDLYLAWSGATTLQRSTINAQASVMASMWGTIEFANITFINYRGSGSVSIDTNKCKFVPLGVPGLFRTVYGPADYIETVNRPGQRMYAKQWRMQNDKGVNLEFQMNGLHYCTRPRILFSARRT